MRLLVTGASGFIGSHVARAAHGSGHDVRCLVRAGSDLGLLGELRSLAVVGDLTDPTSLRAATRNVDAVVHCAAVTSEASPDPALSTRVNVEGTRSLIDACREHHVDRFIFVSTQSANQDNLSAYGRTKLEAERIVAAAGLDSTILRPSTVYGPGARGLFAKIGRYVATLPVVPIIGDGRQRFRPIYVGDVATAILACLAANQTVGRSYDLGGLDGVSFEEFIDGIAAMVGRRPRKLHLPVPLCVALARGLAVVFSNPPLTVDNIAGITQMRECDITPAQRDFGFRPVAFAEGIERLRREQGGSRNGTTDRTDCADGKLTSVQSV